MTEDEEAYELTPVTWQQIRNFGERVVTEFELGAQEGQSADIMFVGVAWATWMLFVQNWGIEKLADWHAMEARMASKTSVPISFDGLSRLVFLALAEDHVTPKSG